MKPEEPKERTKAPKKVEGEDKGEEPKTSKKAEKQDEQKDAGATVEQFFSFLLFQT